jgi:uncharacterized RDD family membrane protein YckC
MNCLSCGEVISGELLPGEALPTEVCRCHSEPPPNVALESRRDAAGSSVPGPASTPDAFEAVEASEQTSDDWRGELSARLNHFRARRKVRPPRYPSLRLPFEPVVAVSHIEATTPQVPPVFEPVSTNALALDMTPQATASESSPEEQPPYSEERSARTAGPSGEHSGAYSGAKIIEFPRFAWGPPPPPPPDQLAEPVLDRPRILDVPETAAPPPALGGITIEAQQRQELEKRPGIDTPLQTSSLARRVLATAIDGLIVAVATALFGLIFWKVAAFQPPKFQLLGLVVGMTALFWAGYQYLLITYSATTPGLRLAGLKLAAFDGTAPRRSLRRWRVLASYLSAASLGMGYAWVFLDEDGLCWHDRATRTHLTRK